MVDDTVTSLASQQKKAFLQSGLVLAIRVEHDLGSCCCLLSTTLYSCCHREHSLCDTGDVSDKTDSEQEEQKLSVHCNIFVRG